ncbi:MAG: transcriptional regulator [Marmoricola sp.]|nr:transcriptional regulator [Marmoricola sp.]
MKSDSDEHNQAMLRVAQLYYEQDLTQSQIASKLLLTRWKVGRLLEDAKERGIVRIEIRHPLARMHDLETRLRSTFDLAHAVVVPRVADAEAQMVTAAVAAAEFVTDLRPAPATLGVSWGHTLDALAENLPPGWARDLHVVQINGALSRSRSPRPAADVATELARRAGGTVSILHSPAILERASTRRAISSDPAVSRVLDAGRGADVLLFSLGALSPRSVLVETGHISVADVRRLRRAGAVGDILGRFVDREGREVDPDLADRTMALSLDDLRSAKLTVAIASSVTKAPIARAAAVSGLCQVLVVDQDIAKQLLETP